LTATKRTEEELCPRDFNLVGYYCNGKCLAEDLLYKSHDTCVKCWTENSFPFMT